MLDADQRRAVDHDDGPLLVVAGPGTGKTRVVVERASRLIERGLAAPENLLVLTFSRRAAAEMRDRLHERLAVSYSEFFVGTFHSLALSLLTRHYDRLGYTARPALLTSEEQWARVARMIRSDAPALWPAGAGRRRLRSFVGDVFDFVLRAQESLRSPDELRAIGAADPDWGERVAFLERYRSSIRAANLVDYGGLMAGAVALLRDHDEVRAPLGERFRYLLVDEYQDTNPAQDRLLALLAGERPNLFVVGDPHQSIYAFRGAALANISSFEDRYRAPRVELKTNYRAAPALVAATDALIARNGATRTLRAADEAAGGSVTGLRFRHAAEELDFVATEILRLHAEDGVPYSQIAILARSLRRLGPHLDGALALREIPRRVVGGGIRLYEHAYVAPMLALLRLAVEVPSDRAAEIDAVGDVLASALFDVDPLAVRALQREARLGRRSMLDVCEDPPAEAAPDDDARAGIGDFLGLRETLAEAAPAARADTLVWRIFDTLACFRALVARDDREALSAIREFYRTVVRFCERHPAPGNLTAFLETTEAGDLGEDPWLSVFDAGADAVTVTTIHQAKGLEFDVVFVPGLVDGAFPSLGRAGGLSAAALAGDPPPRDAARRLALEEERRVLYVALTRARRRVYATATEDPARPLEAAVSRFFAEVPWTADERPPPARRFGSRLDAERAFRRTLAAPGVASLDKALAVAGLRALGVGGSTWWGARPVTHNDEPLYASGIGRQSYSRLSHYENCPLQYLYARELALVEAEGYGLGFGSLAHRVLEAFAALPSGEQTRERLRAIARAQHAETPFQFRAVAHQALRELLAAVDNVFDLEWPPADERLAEHAFEVDVGGVMLRGKIDRIDVVGGRLHVLDYKTGKSSGLTRDEAAEDLQLALYHLACTLDESLARRGPPASLRYLYIQQRKELKTKPPSLRAAEQPVAPGHADRTRERLGTLIDGIRSERFEFSPDADCGYCDFKTVCPRWPQGRSVPL